MCSYPGDQVVHFIMREDVCLLLPFIGSQPPVAPPIEAPVGSFINPFSSGAGIHLIRSRITSQSRETFVTVSSFEPLLGHCSHLLSALGG